MKTLAIAPVGFDPKGLGRQRAATTERVPRLVAGSASSFPPVSTKNVRRHEHMAARADGLFGVVVPAVADGIQGVLPGRTPVQIGRPVVGRVVVAMERPQPFGARTMERLGYDDVNSDESAYSITPEGDLKVAGLRIRLGLEDTTSTMLSVGIAPPILRPADDAVQGADAAVAADFVQAFEAQNGQPDLGGGHG